MSVFNVRIELAGTNVLGNLANPELWEQYIPMFLHRLATQLANLTREYLIRVAQFKHSNGRMAESIRDLQEARSVFVYFDPTIAPYAIHVVKGVHPHQMTYLLGARKQTPTNYLKRKLGDLSPIPISPKAGLFRFPTAESMARGKWMHPGTAPKPVFEWVLERMRPTFLEEARLLSIRVSTGAV